MKTTVFALLAGACVFAAPASAAIVDFESAPASFTSYSDQGATITANGAPISRLATPSGSQGILAEDSPRSEFRADFAGTTGFVSVDLGDFNSDADLLFLEVFDAGNVLLGSSSLAIDASDSVMHTLTATFAGIAYAKFGARAPALNGSSVLADNLTFDLGNGAVPEPATWAMLIAGFGLAGGALRRRSVRLSVA
jgi:hypothetical protein